MAWLLWLHFISLSETKALNSFQNQQSGLQQATEHKNSVGHTEIPPGVTEQRKNV